MKRESYKIKKLREIYDVKKGIVYISRFEINGVPFLKIGYTSKSVKSRMNSILDNQKELKKYNGYSLKIKILDSFECNYPKMMEASIHNNISWLKANLPDVCSGYTELYSINHSDIMDSFKAGKEAVDGIVEDELDTW